MNNILDEFNILSEDVYIDNVGGYHDSGIGWNPHGHWCGECTIVACRLSRLSV